MTGYGAPELPDHMNGRIYDPLLGRFLSADPKVPGPHDLQAYNRYAYVLNNPLRFTDPDGHEPKDVAAGAIEGPAHAIIETGSNNPGLANLNEMAATFSFVARLFGNESKAQYFESVHQDGVQMQQSVENVTEQAKTAASDVASKLTGSTDVNNSQRAITRTGTNLLTKMFVALGGSHLASRLGDAKIGNGSGDKGKVSGEPVAQQAKNAGTSGLKRGDVMQYKDYLAARQKGSSLRGHHIPQAARLQQVGVDPKKGTVVVVENEEHGQTRTYGTKGAKTAAAENGQPLAKSEAADLADNVMKSLGTDVADKIREMNRRNHPEQFK